MSDRDRQVIFKLAEYAAIAATTAGIIISVLFNQSLYALIPMAIWLLIGFLSRQHLTQQVRRFHREVIEIQQHLEVTLPLIAQLPGLESILSQLPQIIQKANSIPSQNEIQQLQTTLGELNTDLQNSQAQQEAILHQEAQYMSQITQLQEQVQQLAQTGVNSQDMLKLRSQFQHIQQRLEQLEMGMGITPNIPHKSPELPFENFRKTSEKNGDSELFDDLLAEDEKLITETQSHSDKSAHTPNFDDFMAIVDSDETDEDFEEEDEDLLEAELQKEEYSTIKPPPTAFPESKEMG
ncbi:MAG: hypothetical protein ACLFV6_18895 [Spirulinaceae cyanobacterium]